MGGGNVENNLSKVERAFIIDFNKSTASYGIINEYTSFIEENLKYFSTLLHPYSTLNDARNKSYYIVSQADYNYKGTLVMGFTINQYSSNIPIDFFTQVYNYCIEIPIDSYYNLSDDKRIYNLDITKTSKEQIIDIKKILDQFNIKEGETQYLNGYIIPIFQKVDDWGYILAAKKTNSSYYIYEIRNGQYNEYDLDEVI